MRNLIVHEDVIHYAARFLERWEEKAPNKEHKRMCEELREMSDYLLENLYNPMFISVLRVKKKE